MLNTTINTLIFDLDNTLLDRNHAMRLTIGGWLKTQGHTGDEHLQSTLDEIMAIDQWGYTDRLEFCAWLLRTYGNKENQGAPPETLLDYVLRHISSHVHPDLAVNEVLLKASKSFRLALATNGRVTTQSAKLRQARLESFFQPGTVFISEEVGYKKPDKRYYEKLIHRLQLDPSTAMFIGDDLINDVAGPQESGMSACWIAHGRSNGNGIKPEKVIQKITELSEWLK